MLGRERRQAPVVWAALLVLASCGQSKERYVVSGAVSGAVSQGITMTLTGPTIVTTTTAADGRYSIAGIASGSYALSPSRAGYVFDPPFVTITVVDADVSGRDFAATALGGTLDAGFGDEGMVSTPVGPAGGFANAIAIQVDGRIVVGGIAASHPSGGIPASFALARYLPDGRLDATFGSSGIVSTTFDEGESWVNGIAIQADGKIVAAGVAGPGFALARYGVDGSLDPGFGSGGVVTEAAGASGGASAVLALRDGKILAAGSAVPSAGGPALFALLRLNGDGSVDSGFGDGGIVTTAMGALQDGITSIALRGDGGVLAAGYSFRGPGEYGLVLAQYDAGGGLDGSFGSSGRVDYAAGVGTSAWANAVAIQPDGRIVVAGLAEDPRSISSTLQSVLLRYTQDGSLDEGFGTAGQVVGIAQSRANAVGVDGSGRIVSAGFVADYPAASHFQVVRVNGDGGADQSFGAGGEVTTVLSPFGDAVKAIAIQADGMIVAAGISNDAGSGQVPATFGLARYWP